MLSSITMWLSIFGVLLSFVAIVQCYNQFSLLNELKSLDFMQSLQQILTANLTDSDDLTQSGDRERTYDWNECVTELRAIADGLDRTEWWAIRCK